MNASETQKICLTIAGVDPSGGAGIYADLKSFSAFGCYGTAAITSITFQNTTGVFGAIHQSPESVRSQIQPIIDDFEISATKTGMLPTVEIIEEIAKLAAENRFQNFVVDPVVRSTSGFDLIDDHALRSLIENLFPVSDLITPNLAEAERITQMSIRDEKDLYEAARKMQNLGAKNVLIKGGHFPEHFRDESNGTARDFLFIAEKIHILESEYIRTKSTHGTGCTLASAIAANLANGKNLIESVEAAKTYVTNAIKTAPHIGSGNGPINHLVKL